MPNDKSLGIDDWGSMTGDRLRGTGGRIGTPRVKTSSETEFLEFLGLGRWGEEGGRLEKALKKNDLTAF